MWRTSPELHPFLPLLNDEACIVQRVEAVLLLLLLKATRPGSTGRRSNAKGILTVRKADATTFYQAPQSVAIEIVERSGGMADVFKLHQLELVISDNKIIYSHLNETHWT